MKKTQILNLSDSALDEVVQIQGTVYDRKRVMDNLEVKNAARMLASGKSTHAVAKHFGVSPSTIKYNTDAVYRETVLMKASGKHTGYDTCDFADRVEYKRSLVEAGKKVIVRQ